MSHWVRSWAAAAGAVIALTSAPVAIMTTLSPAVSLADVCVSGQVLNDAGVCVNVVPPPPPPPQPEGTACVTATGRRGHVSGGACVET
jgi:hypothetical protein